MCKELKLMVAGILLVMAVSPFAVAEMKDYVFVVRPELSRNTIEMFETLATWHERNNYPDYAEYFRYYTGEQGGGTGWIYVDSDGENYIITNRHVVSTGSTANIYMETPDGSRKVYQQCPILYVDDQMDLAVLQFPDRDRPFDKGFVLDTGSQRDLQRVVSAGFPGFGSRGEQIWQLASGEITNARLRTNEPYFQGYEYLIQHSAPIDHGNSGGPLLVEDPGSSLGYKVIGVNTFKGFAGDRLRENTFLAIPAKEVEQVLEKARAVRTLGDDADKRKEELIVNCKILAAELRSESRDENTVNQYISYEFVGNRGWESYQQLQMLMRQVNPAMSENMHQSFYSGQAIEVMRHSIYLLFYQTLFDRGSLSSIEFKEINFADDRRFADLKEVRTEFLIDDQPSEIVWTLEHGKWRISDFQLLELGGSYASSEGTAQKRQRPARAGGPVLDGVRFGVGGSAGTAYSVSSEWSKSHIWETWVLFSWSLEGRMDIPLSDVLALGTGLYLIRKGVGYTFEGSGSNYHSIEESLMYLQVPSLLKVFVPNGLVQGIGPANNFNITRKATLTWSDSEVYPETLDDYWFDYLNSFNISLNVLIGYEFMMNEKSALGFETGIDYHLLDDYSYNDTYHFFNWKASVYITF